MIFSSFSLIISIIWVSIFAKIASLLRKRNTFTKYFSIYSLLFLLFLCVMRLLMPAELPYTLTVESTNILPMVQSLFNYPIFQLSFLDINLNFMLITGWLIGAMIVMLKHMIHYYHLKRILNLFPKTDDKRLCDIFSKVNTSARLSNINIVIHPLIKSPAIVGIIKPIIILPNITFTDDELYYIFLHECAHYRCGHVAIKMVTEIIQSLFWWNPFIKQLFVEVAHALEMHSDRKVCEVLHRSQDIQYLHTLIKVVSNLGTEKNRTILSCSMVEEDDSEKLQQRFRMILEGNYHNKKLWSFLAIPAILLMFLFSYTVVLQPYSEPDLEGYGEMDTVAPDSYMIKTEDGYSLYSPDNTFIGYVKYIDESLENLEIYDNREEIQ